MISYIEALEALAQEGTMVKAGTRLRLTQSAISKRIQALEDHLRQPLIEKRGRRVALTTEAVAFLEKTKPLLAELRAAVHADDSIALDLITYGVSESILSSWGTKMLAKVGQKWPDIGVALHAQRSASIIERVTTGEYLFGLCAGDVSATKGLHTQIIMREPMVVIPSGLKPIGKGRKALDVITIDEHSRTWDALALPTRRLNISPVQRMESFFAVAQAGLAGLGHALVPYGVAKTLRIPLSSLVSFRKEDLCRPVTLISRTSAFGRPLVRDIWEDIAKEGYRLGGKWN